MSFERIMALEVTDDARVSKIPRAYDPDTAFFRR